MAKGKYTVLHQDDTHFLMRHPDGSDFRVAKQMIDPITRKEIQHMADGGDVGNSGSDELDPAKAEAAKAVSDFTASPATDIEGTIPGRELASSPVGGAPFFPTPTGQAPPAVARMLPSGSAEAAGDGSGEAPDSVSAARVPPFDRDMAASGGPTMAPQGVSRDAASSPPPPPPSAAPTQKSGSAQAGTASTGEPNKSGMYDFQAQQLLGAQQRADAEKKAGQATAASYGELANNLKAAVQEFQSVHKLYNDRSEQLMQEIASSKVDPNHYWENKSAGGKVSAAIGIVLAGIGGGLNGTGQNMALETINKAIDRDIDAQKSNLANKNSLLNHNLNLTHDQESALALTKSNMLAITTAQAGKIAGEAAGPLAQANLNMLQGQLKQQFLGQNFELAKRQALSKFMSGSAGAGSALPLLFAGDVKADQFVQLPNGDLKIAASAEDAKKVKEVQTKIGNINGIVQNMKEFRQKHGATVYGSDADAQGERLRNSLILEFGELADLARFTPEERKIYTDLTSHPGRLRGDKFESNVQHLESLMRNKLESTYGSYIMGYKPVRAHGR